MWRALVLTFGRQATSGLDSVMGESVVCTLQHLARQGRLVMASVHSPSSHMVKRFTHLLVLTSDGRLAYHGPRDRVVQHFTAMG